MKGRINLEFTYSQESFINFTIGIHFTIVFQQKSQYIAAYKRQHDRVVKTQDGGAVYIMFKSRNNYVVHASLLSSNHWLCL